MYEIKAKYAEQNVHLVVEDATDLFDALEMGVQYGVQEVYAVNLNSSIKEIIYNPEATQGIWYMGTIRETIMIDDPDGKRPPKAKKVRYNVLLQADTIEDANKLFNDTLQQGYDAVARGIKETDIFDIVRRVATENNN